MKLSTKGRYGLKAMFQLSLNQSNGPIPLKNIASKQNISEQVKKHLPFKKAKIGDIVIAKFKNDAGIIGASAL